MAIPLKKWEKPVERDTNGRFVRGSKPLSAGRPPGALNKATRHLKEAILRAAEEVGGEEGLTGYLKMLAVQNTAAFAALMGKILPTQLAAEGEEGQTGMRVVFERRIVYPTGHVEVQEIGAEAQAALPAPELRSDDDWSK